METPKGKLIAIGGSQKSDRQLESGEKAGLSMIIGEVLAEIKKPDPVIELLNFGDGIQGWKDSVIREVFRESGHEIDGMDAVEVTDLESEEMLGRLKKADCVFITGENQNRLVNLLEDTRFLEILKRRYTEDDFIIAGKGAGAMIMSEYVINVDEPEESILKGNIKLTEGLEFLPGTIIDTNFLKMGRLSRLTEALLVRRDCTGLGIYEDTAVIISEGNIIRPIGSGTVTVIETYELGNTNYDYAGENNPIFAENLKIHVLAPGAKYHLKEKKFVVLEEALAG